MKKYFILTCFLTAFAVLTYGQQKKDTLPKANQPKFELPNHVKSVHKVRKKQPPKVTITKFSPPKIVKDTPNHDR